MPLEMNCLIFLRYTPFVFLNVSSIRNVDYQAQCDDSTLKKFEFEFHSAGYLTLLEAIEVIKNVLGHLIILTKVRETLWCMVLMTIPNIWHSQDGNQKITVQSQTVLQFMIKLDVPVFSKANMHTSLSLPQQAFLENLHISMAFSCLQQLIQWLKDGMYDFCTLPTTLRTHIAKEDLDALYQIPSRWKAGTEL